MERIHALIEEYGLVLFGENNMKPTTKKVAANDIEFMKANKEAFLEELHRRVQAQKERNESFFKKIEAKATDLEQTLVPESVIEFKMLNGKFLAGEFGRTSVGTRIFENLAKIDMSEALKEYSQGASFDDYSVSISYKMTLAQLLAIEELALATLAEKEASEQAELQAKFEEAKTTGRPVVIRTYHVDCHDPKVECNLDIVTLYAMPDGTTKTEQVHTY